MWQETFDDAAADHACAMCDPDGAGDWYEFYSNYWMGEPLDNRNCEISRVRFIVMDGNRTYK